MRIKRRGTIVSLIFIILVISSGCTAPGTSGTYQHNAGNPPQAPAVGMDSGNIFKDLGLEADTKMRKETSTVYPLATRENVEIAPGRTSGKLVFLDNNCSFSYDDKGIAGLTCEIASRSNSSYADIAAEAFESGVWQCLVNMNKKESNIVRIGTAEEKVVCILNKKEPYTCIIGGAGYFAHMPGGVTSEFIDGCRMGAMASNSAYGTEMELMKYTVYVPADSF